MEAERTRILEMLREGKVTVEQAGDLLSALEQSRGAEQEGGKAQPDARKMDWSQFGQMIAEQVQRHVGVRLGAKLAGKFGGSPMVGDLTRENYGSAKLGRDLVEQMEDGTAYQNYGQLEVLAEVPEDLLDRKIGSITNFGWVTGPANLVAILERKCVQNYGGFSPTEGYEKEAGWPRGFRPPRPPKPPRRTFDRTKGRRLEEAVLTSYSVDDDRIGLEITCHTGNLELTGAEGGELRLLALRPAGGSSPEGWEQAVPWSSDREGGAHRFTLGDPDNRDATKGFTFRVEIPCEADLRATTEGGDIAASSLTGALHLNTGGGDIAVSEIEGSLDADTGGGDISVSDIEGETTLDTGGGNISANDVEGALRAKTGGGNISLHDIEGEVSAMTGGGDVSVSDVEGSVTARTGGGNISVSDVEGDVGLAETGGGSIAVSDVSGSVKARSGGGDIAVSDVEGELSIDAGGGSTAITNVSGPVRMGR